MYPPPVNKICEPFLGSSHLSSDADEAALNDEATANAERIARAFLDTQPDAPSSIFDSLYAKLPKAYEWQREEVMAAGPKGEHH